MLCCRYERNGYSLLSQPLQHLCPRFITLYVVYTIWIMYATLPFNYIYIYKLIGVRTFAAYSNLLPVWHNMFTQFSQTIFQYICCRCERNNHSLLSQPLWTSVTAPYASKRRLSHTTYICNSNIQLYSYLQPKFCCTQTLRRVRVPWPSNITIIQFLPTIFRHIFNLFLLNSHIC